MNNELSKAYVMAQEIKEAHDEKRTHESDLTGIKRSQWIFAIATFFIYFSFTSVIFAGVTVWNLQDYIFGNYTNVIGMVWVLVTVLVVPLGLSLAKLYNYRAIAKGGDRRLILVRAIIALAIASGLYYEAISSSSNLQAKAHHAVENSQAGAAILNTTVSSSSGAGIAGLIADAEFKLKACERKVKDGTYKDCNNSTARLESLKAQADAERESVASANVAAIGAKQKALSAERDEHAIPAAKFTAEAVAMSVAAGTMIIVIIASFFFELIHLTTIFNEFRALRGLQSVGAQLKRLNAEYFGATGKPYTDGDFQDSRRIDLSEQPLNVSGNHDGSDKPLFKYQDQQPDTAKPMPTGASAFVGTGVPSGLALAADKVLSAFGEKAAPTPTPDQLTAQQRKANSEKWRKALQDRNIPVPAEGIDRALEQNASDETINNILGELKPCNAGKQSPEQRKRAEALASGAPLHGNDWQAGQPEIQNELPLNGGESEADQKPVSNHVHTVTPKSDSNHVHTVKNGLYEQWVEAVNSGGCRASVASTRNWIQKQIAPTMTGSKTNDLKRIDAMRKAFHSRAIADGRMKSNPNWSNGKAKYIWEHQQ